MTDHQRDQIDRDAQHFMKTCFASIALLKTQGRLNSDFGLIPLLDIKNGTKTYSRVPNNHPPAY